MSALAGVERVIKRYAPPRRLAPWRRQSAKVAVDDVTLAVAEGEALGIVGESGSGKSTLARLLVGLEAPSAGVVRWRGEDVTVARGRRLRALRRERQMVFQDPVASLNPRRTVGASLAEPFAIHGLLADRRARRRRVAELLEQVGLEPAHADAYPHELSGGMRQRVGIARALALEPRLLVADEPVSALDVSVQAQVLSLLAELRRQLGLTLVLIAHDLAVVRAMCDRVAVMSAGRVVEAAAVDDLFSAPQAQATRVLLAAAPRLTPPGEGSPAGGAAAGGEAPGWGRARDPGDAGAAPGGQSSSPESSASESSST